MRRQLLPNTTNPVPPSELLVFDRARDIPATAWDSLAGPPDLFLGSRWLRVAESVSGVPMRYFLLLRGGTPVAAVPTALADSSVPWVHGRLDTVLAAAARDELVGAREQFARLGPPDALMPSVSAGGRHSGNTRVLTAPDTTAEELQRVLAAVEDHALRRAPPRRWPSSTSTRTTSRCAGPCASAPTRRSSPGTTAGSR